MYYNRGPKKTQKMTLQFTPQSDNNHNKLATIPQYFAVIGNCECSLELCCVINFLLEYSVGILANTGI